MILAASPPRWIYDFDSHKELAAPEFQLLLNNLKKLGNNERDPTDVGHRLLVDEFQAHSPLFVECIYVVFYYSSQASSLFVDLGVSKNIESEWLNLATTRKRDKATLCAQKKMSLISPREAIKLCDPSLKGFGCKISLIDSGFNVCPEKSKIAEMVNLSRENGMSEIGSSHGTKILSVIQGSAGAIAPSAEVLLVRITPKKDGYPHSATPAAAIIGMIYSANRNVDIISISYALSRTQNSDIIESLKRTIDYCFSKKVLIVTTTENDLSMGVSAIAASNSECVIAVNGILNSGFPIYDSPDLQANFHCASRGQDLQTFDDLCNIFTEVEGDGVSVAVPIVAAALAIHMQETKKRFLDLKESFLTQRCSPPACKDTSKLKFFGRGVVSFKCTQGEIQ